MILKLQKMRQSAYSLILLLFTCAIGYSAIPLAVDKVIEKDFPISADGTVNIQNKYGSVVVTESNSNQVSIKITIEVKTSSEDRAQKVFDQIDVNFSNSSDYVSAVTEIADNSGWSSWFSWGSNINYKINYEVKMPISAHLKLTNKYGDVNLTDLNNGLDLVMKYGNVNMRSVEGTTSLDLGYGNVDFGDLGDLNATIKYSKLEGSSAQEVTITSKYSTFKCGDLSSLRSDTKYDTYLIDKVGEIKNNGKYDKWVLKEVEHFKISSKYSPIRIDKLLGDLQVDQKYGSVEVDDVACKNATIDIDAEYTDVQLGMGSCGVDLDFQGEYMSVRLPREMEDRLERDDEDVWLKDKFGNSERRVRLRLRHASLKIWD